jgi:NADH-quinone oxidoreductase subunit M
LAVCFLLTGLAGVGFPGTLGYVATELLVGGAVDASPAVGVAAVVASALNGIAILRAYFLIFTGGRHVTGVSLGVTAREWFAVLTLAALIIGGGLAPRYLIETRSRAAELLLQERAERAGGGVMIDSPRLW